MAEESKPRPSRKSTEDKPGGSVVSQTVTCRTINKDSTPNSVFAHYSTLGTKFRKESSMKIRPALTLVKHNSSLQRGGLFKYVFFFVKEDSKIETRNLPEGFKKYPQFLIFLLLVFPHRMRFIFAEFLDDVTNKV